jgi:ketosteroid isomerase-like protein
MERGRATVTDGEDMKSPSSVLGITAETPEEATVVALFQALNNRHLDEVRALHTQDAKWWLLSRRIRVPVEAWIVGFDGVISKRFSNGVTFDLIGFTSQGNRVAAQATCSGIRDDGVAFDNAYHFLFEFDSQRISAAWEYGDTLHGDRVLFG